ncbi:MAG TPA: hypothetical protein VIQ27_06750 [Gemmatimonadales bacterium]|jgi:hypothetical protein
MSREALQTYLNDHLAGSVMAVQMAERTIRENEGGSIAVRLSRVLEEIREDQAVLKGLIERVGAGESPVKKAGAWLAEKAGRLKLGGTDEPGELSRLEVLEILTMGIHGKQALWRTLRVAAPGHEGLRGLDYDLLEHRAIRQHEAVEAMRLEAAAEVL